MRPRLVRARPAALYMPARKKRAAPTAAVFYRKKACDGGDHRLRMGSKNPMCASLRISICLRAWRLLPEPGRRTRRFTRRCLVAYAGDVVMLAPNVSDSSRGRAQALERQKLDACSVFANRRAASRAAAIFPKTTPTCSNATTVSSHRRPGKDARAQKHSLASIAPDSASAPVIYRRAARQVTDKARNSARSLEHFGIARIIRAQWAACSAATRPFLPSIWSYGGLNLTPTARCQR